MALIHSVEDGEGKKYGWLIFCPACHCGHLFPTANGRWTWSGSAEKPTFRPSMLIHGNPPKGDEVPGYRPQKRCHLFVTDGRIEYCADSEHDLAGKTIPMVDLDVDHHV